MQGHALDPQAAAALLEFGGTIARTHLPQVGKSGPVRTCTQDLRHLFAEMDPRRYPVFFRTIADDLSLPVNVLGLETRDVPLRRTQVPRQLVKGSAFGIGSWAMIA